MDDATGTVPAALFCREEDTPSYFLLMNKPIQQCGIPLAYYNDRHPVIKFTGDIDRYPAGPTQFARAMEELGIRQIFARSPQAKELVSEVEASHDNRSKRELTGRIIVPDSSLTQRRPFKSTIVVRQNTFETGSKGRVERAAGTIQDRLVTDLRLAGAVTIAEANEVLNGFLPRFNEKFGVQAEQDCPAYRFLEHSVSLDGILCFKHRRKASRDNTVKYNRRTLQLPPGVTRPTFAGMQVEVQEDLVGRLLVQYQGQTIPSQEASPRPAQLRETAAAPPGGSGLDRGINGAGVQCDSHLATLKTGEVDRDLRPRKSRAQQHKIPTARIGLCGRMCSRPSSGDSPSGRSPANWASTETP